MKIGKIFNNIFLLTILSIILFAILPIKSQTNVLVYNESETDNVNTPRIFAMDRFDDNTIIAHIIRRNSVPTEEKFCVDKYLSFRTILPDGLVKAIDIPLDLQDINFCIFNVKKVLYNPIKIYTV